MSKNIVVCSDGTGNSGGKRRGTNVWRIFNAVDRHRSGCEQVTYYDDGVGTHNLRLLRLFGAAFGWGLSRNIREMYEFLALNHEEGDKIFLFGFSRGAFTVRSLAGMICRCGLLERDALVSAERRERKRAVRRVLCAYRKENEIHGDGDVKKIRKSLGIGDLRLRSVEIHFIGVWDTVDAVGVPFPKLKVWLDYRIWRRIFKRRLWGFHDRKLHPSVRHARQALALDDERKTFHPLIWKDPNTDPEDDAPQTTNENDASRAADDGRVHDGHRTVKQIWFAGVHSNIGGGYPKDSLSLVPLLWMMRQANACGLQFLERKLNEYREDSDPNGRLYDSRTGWRAFYRYAPRSPYAPDPDAESEVTPAVHESVFERIKRTTGYYAPKALRPDGYTVVRSNTRP